MFLWNELNTTKVDWFLMHSNFMLANSQEWYMHIVCGILRIKLGNIIYEVESWKINIKAIEVVRSIKKQKVTFYRIFCFIFKCDANDEVYLKSELKGYRIMVIFF